MTDPYDASPPLTSAQQDVVDLPADTLALVTAGAGAGKTHTLVRRLDRLVAEEDLSAGEILVLTFSRAAVRELRNRLLRHGNAAGHVRAQTFDSWALSLLIEVDASTDWAVMSFDVRIEGARAAIDDGLADELYEDLRHVVIDEVQDLVGARRELVESLIDRFECGFTLVGDTAQSIYGFTVPDAKERPSEANRFFEWLRNTFGEDLTELPLEENFRALTDDARAALPYGPRLRELTESRGDDGRSLHRDLRDTLRGQLNLGKLDTFVASSLAEYPGTTAVLCRTNGQALVISEELAANGVRHRLQRSARDRVTPIWIGLLFRATESAILTRSTFDGLIPSLPLPDGAEPDQLWRLLQKTGNDRGGDRVLDLRRLRVTIANGRLPDEFTAQPPAKLVVSSFHRAKGLEFDRVVVVDPGPLQHTTPNNDKRRSKKPREIDTAEEARLLYVAMTRPREELLWLNALEMRSIRTDHQLDRWARYSPNPSQYWMRLGLEVIGGDVFTDQPAGMRDFEGDVLELQEYLTKKVSPGDDVVLERLFPDAIGSEESPPYLIMHGDRPIGAASDQFRQHLYRHLKLNSGYEPRNWPLRLTGVRVDAIETVAGSEAAGVRSGLGQYGVWLAPRLMGLSTFDWDKNTKGADSDVTA